MKIFFRLFFIACLTIPFFSFAQTGTDYTITLNNGNTITFPYQIQFSPAQISLIKTLDRITLEKLVQVARQVKEKNKQTTTGNTTETNTAQTIYSNTQSAQTPYYNPTTRQYQSKPVDASQQTTFSNQQSNLTPYYNPQTGQYQSTPAQNSSGNPFLDSNTSNSSNPFLGTGNNSLLQSGTQLQNFTQGLTNGLTGGSVDMSNLDILDMCKPGYGVNFVGGSCPDIQNTTDKLKKTTALACSAIKKKISTISVYRYVGCANDRGGPHTKGIAIDIIHSDMTSEQKQKVFEVFKKSGFEGYGCYGPNKHVHLDHGNPRRWGPNGSRNSWDPNLCPQELFLAGYAR